MSKKYYTGDIKTHQEMKYKTFKINSKNEMFNQLATSTTLWFATIVAIVVACFIMMFPVMWLWNWLMPAIFGLCKINAWQALGLNLLSSFFFKSNKS